MSMDLQIRHETFGVPEDMSWLKTSFGLDDAHSITINGIAAGAGVGVTNGFIKSGTVMAIVTSGGLYSVYDDANSPAGVAVAVGILKQSIQLKKNDAGDYADCAAALMWHGDVIESKLTGIDANAKTDMGNAFKYNAAIQ